MKVLICDEPGKLSVIDRPEPKPGPGEALVRIRRVGICGTDFHIFQGKHPFLEYPRVMGHELSGTVESAPEGSGLQAGQNVYIVPYLSCGRCVACRKGITNACQNISVLGVHKDGGMAELLCVPVGNVVPVGDTPLEDAAMTEFLAIGAHGVKRGGISAQDRVLVVGSGPIGMSAIIFAKARGAHVTVMDMREDRLAFTQDRLGADALLLASPEYNYSIAPALKNALDWLSREPNNGVLAGKTAAIMGSGGGMGTSRAQYHLRQVCVFLDLHLVNKPEVFCNSFGDSFNAAGELVDERIQGLIQQQLQALAELTGKIRN